MTDVNLTGKVLNRELDKRMGGFLYRELIPFSNLELMLIHPKKTLAMCHSFWIDTYNLM